MSYRKMMKRTNGHRHDINDEFVQISKEFPTEDDAVQYCRDNDLDNKYKWVRIYTDKGLQISGW